MKLDKFTVGKRYGKALFELAVDKQETDSIYQGLLDLRKVYELLPDVGNILSDARLEPNEKRAVMNELVKNFDGILHDFLEVVFSYNRMNDLLLMINEYEKRYNHLKGLIIGTVTTAVPLADEKKQQIEEKIARLLGYQRAKLNAYVDPKIIGGVVVEAEHQVIDGSVAAKLEDISKQLRK